ncbi:unnamed protein product [Blepharisma stoltei]|uniref:Uncharacterized protein n=1 Tax=Blepharisma stoltei TaxID=1481888 RepID=A0AAU9IDP3_9CILI|nr:unnamed protein product [Blepharisma stoltei]
MLRLPKIIPLPLWKILLFTRLFNNLLVVSPWFKMTKFLIPVGLIFLPTNKSTRFSSLISEKWKSLNFLTENTPL